MRALLAVLMLFAGTARAAERIISLNLCTDQYLALLAPTRAVALSPLARDPALSVVAQAARDIAWVRPDAEAVLALRPDLVLAGPFGAQTTLAAVARRGVPILRTGLPQDFPAIRAETRRFAAALDAGADGERLLADMDALLAAIPAHPARAVLPLAPRGYLAGPGSLEDSVIRAAGHHNATRHSRVGLEAILADPPDLILLGDAPGFPSLATDMVRHPVLAGIPRRSLHPADMICAGPWTARAVRDLAAP